MKIKKEQQYCVGSIDYVPIKWRHTVTSDGGTWVRYTVTWTEETERPLPIALPLAALIAMALAILFVGAIIGLFHQ